MPSKPVADRSALRVARRTRAARALPRPSLVSALLAITALGLAAPTPAAAADGVLEISQACAAGPGCFAGDTPGFPVLITSAAGGRSFVLTSDLVVPTPDDTGIRVEANDVAIDLGGFSIMGVACVSTLVNCRPIAANGKGIDARPFYSPAVTGFRVSNGSVIGMGSHGVDAGLGATIRGVIARWNARNGFQVGPRSSVEGASAIANGQDGFDLIDFQATSLRMATIIRNSISTLNIDHGIACAGGTFGSGLLLEGNSITDNDGNGIRCSNESRIVGNVVLQNDGAGVTCGAGCQILDNDVSSNGNAPGGNGIQCGEGCLVDSNIVRANFEHGLFLGATSAYRDNVISQVGGGGAPATGGVNLGGNLCEGVVCP